MSPFFMYIKTKTTNKRPENEGEVQGAQKAQGCQTSQKTHEARVSCGKHEEKGNLLQMQKVTTNKATISKATISKVI
jgi:hypothetical protein